MNTKKHILIIPSELYQTDMQPLGGIFQRHEAELLSKNGFQVGVLSVGIITPRYLFHRNSSPLWESCGGINIIRKYEKTIIPNRIKNKRSARDIFISNGLHCYSEYINKYGQPCMIHAHNLKYASLLAYEIKMKFGVPYFITEHSSSFIRFKNEAEDLACYSQTINSAECFSTVSKSLSNTINKIFNDKNFEIVKDTLILYNLLDEKLTHYASKLKPKNKAKSSPFIFINVASLDDNKNQQIILKAFASEFKGKPYLLKIIGSGNNLNSLRDLSKKLGINKQVIFLGYLNREPLFEELKQANCFILSSNVETFGVVLIEAAAIGLPLIATKSGGPEEIIKESNGLLVDKNNATAMAEAMLHIEKNYSKYDNSIISAETLSKYGGNEYLNKICTIIKEASL